MLGIEWKWKVFQSRVINFLNFRNSLTNKSYAFFIALFFAQHFPKIWEVFLRLFITCLPLRVYAWNLATYCNFQHWICFCNQFNCFRVFQKLFTFFDKFYIFSNYFQPIPSFTLISRSFQHSKKKIKLRKDVFEHCPLNFRFQNKDKQILW